MGRDNGEELQGCLVFYYLFLEDFVGLHHVQEPLPNKDKGRVPLLFQQFLQVPNKDIDCAPVPFLDMVAVDRCDFLEHLHMLADISFLPDLVTDVVQELAVYFLVVLGEDGEVLAHVLDCWLFGGLKKERLEGQVSHLKEVVLLLYFVQLEGATFEDQADQRPLVVLELRLGVILESLGIQRCALELHLAGLLEGLSHFLTDDAQEEDVEHSADDPLAVEVLAGLLELFGHRVHEHIVPRVLRLLLVDLLQANLKYLLDVLVVMLAVFYHKVHQDALVLRVHLTGEYLNHSFLLALVPQELELALVPLEDAEALEDDLVLHALALYAQVDGHQRPEEDVQTARLAESLGYVVQGFEVVL